MKNIREALLMAGVLVLYAFWWMILHPWLGHMLDSDGVAYLTMAEQAAKGEWMRSVNGLWSPLNSWLLVPFIRMGYEPFAVAKVMNGAIGAVLLVQVHVLFRRFRLSFLARTLLLSAAAIAVGFFTYFQMFGDVLQLLFAMTYLQLLCSPRFFSSLLFPALAGLLMGLGFYAKAYSLMFFLLHFAVILFFAFRKGLLIKQQVLRFLLTGYVVALLSVLPWTLALHQKYEVWTFSGLAGKLNMSWYINSGKTFKPEIRLLIPPPYADSPAFWEDPWLSQDKLSSPLSSPRHFMRWTARVVHTTLVAIGCMNELSVLGIGLILLGVWYFLMRQKTESDKGEEAFPLLVLWLTILLLPSGYLLMHIETRYLWLSVFPLMVLGAFWAQHYLTGLQEKAAIFVLAVSFILTPLLQTEQLKGKNSDLFRIAEELKAKGFEGKFTANVQDAGTMWVIAYLTGSNFYTIEKSGYSREELLQEMDRYGVEHYLLRAENNPVDTTGMGREFEFAGRTEDVLWFRRAIRRVP
jgi:hypothetical protein